MKREKILTGLISGLLAFCLALGAMGSMITGLYLNIERMWLVVFAWAFFAAFGTVCFLIKRGGTVMLCLTALLAGFLWRGGQAWQQCVELVCHISEIYDMAYGWGYLSVEGAGANCVDYPVGILGCIIAICVSWSICRQKSAVLPAIIALLPLVSCLVVTDTVPATGYLFALMLGLIILALTSTVRQYSASQGNLLTAMVAVPAALALGILFLASPQEDYVNQAQEYQDALLEWFQELPEQVEQLMEPEEAVKPVEPETEDLQNLGSRFLRTLVMMEVTAEESGMLYLRGQDFDTYTGTSWISSTERAEDFGLEDGRDAGEVTIRTRAGTDHFYLPYYPEDAVELTAGRLENPEKSLQYTFRRTALPTGWREAAGEALFYTVNTRNTALPDDTLAWASALVETILTDETSATEKAEAIADFVRSSAVYDLNPRRMDEDAEDFVRWFIEESDKGYCVHFATATAVLLRAAGIEARYVTGYMTQAAAGQRVEVTAAQAHAWAEYYEPALGAWIVLESTPADLSTEATGPAATDAATLPGTTDGPAPTEQTEEPSAAPTEREEQTQPAEPADTAPDSRTPHRLPVVGWIFLAALTLLAILAQRGIRVELRRQRIRRGKPNAQALGWWQEAQLLYGLLKQEPPQELELLAQKARFSQHTLTREELQLFAAACRDARNQLRQKPWYARLMYCYIHAAW